MPFQSSLLQQRCREQVFVFGLWWRHVGIGLVDNFEVQLRDRQCITRHEYLDFNRLSVDLDAVCASHIHDNFIVTRQPIDNIQGVASEFEYFRKLLINLESQVSGTLSGASTDGLNRGRRVLAEIATKVRRAKSR